MTHQKSFLLHTRPRQGGRQQQRHPSQLLISCNYCETAEGKRRLIFYFIASPFLLLTRRAEEGKSIMWPCKKGAEVASFTATSLFLSLSLRLLLFVPCPPSNQNVIAQVFEVRVGQSDADSRDPGSILERIRKGPTSP